MNAAQGRYLSNADQMLMTRKKPQAAYEVSGKHRVV
jgi:hypothetical protein